MVHRVMSHFTPTSNVHFNVTHAAMILDHPLFSQTIHAVAAVSVVSGVSLVAAAILSHAQRKDREAERLSKTDVDAAQLRDWLIQADGSPMATAYVKSRGLHVQQRQAHQIEKMIRRLKKMDPEYAQELPVPATGVAEVAT